VEDKNLNTLEITNPQDNFNKLMTQAGTNYLGTRKKLPEDIKVGFGTALIAQFQNENTVGNLIASIRNGTANISRDANPDYDPTDDIPEDKFEYWDSYATASSPQDVDKITRKLDRELENRKTLSQAGLGKSLATGLIAGILDPINLIPVGGTAYKTGKLGKVGSSILNTATAGFVSSVAQETILQSQQETRTPEETAINIAGGTILAGILGGAGALYSKTRFKKLAKKVQEDVHAPKSDIQLDPETQEVLDSTVGAKQYREIEKLQLDEAYKTHIEESLQKGKKPLTEQQFIDQQQSLVTRKGAGVVIKSLSKANPLLRIFNSKSTKAKEMLQRLGTHNMLVAKNLNGIASQSSVENSIKQHRAGLGLSIKDGRKAYLDYKKRIKQEGVERSLKKVTDFNEEVAKTLRRGDVSDIPEVERVAKQYRSKVFEPLKEQAIELGLLPEDVKVKTAVSYLTRMYNRRKIIAQEPILRQRMSDKLKNVEIPKIKQYFEVEQKQLISRIDSNERQLSKLQDDLRIAKEKGDLESSLRLTSEAKIKKLQAENKRLNESLFEKQRIFGATFDEVQDIDAYVENIVDDVLHKLKGFERQNVSMPYDLKIAERGPLKERTLNFMDDAELEDFLENDIEKIADGYSRVMGTDVELQKEFGSLTLEKEIEEVSDEYAKLAKEAKTETQRTKLAKERKETVRDLQAMRDIMRGFYGRSNDPDSLITRGSRISRQVQYLSKLGGITISSIPDLARPIFVHGYGRVFNKGLRNLGTNLKGIKLNVKEAQLAGNVLESVLNTRLATLAELTDPYSSGSKFERVLTNMSNTFSKITGLVHWNDTMKGFSSVITQQRVIEDSAKLLSGKIKPKDRTYLAFLGIDESVARKISKQLEQFSEMEGNLTIANTEKWTDQNAVRAFRNAINLDVDRTIITKTAGDIPLMMNTELGKTVGQFKSFTFAATQQALIAGLQQGDTAALQGLISILSLGSLVYYLKSKGAGREPDMSPAKLVVEGLDRSGMLGILSEVNNMAEKATAGRIGINALAGGEIMSRYASRNLIGNIAGPSLGTIQDLTTITSAIGRGEISEGDIRAVRRLTPYQNLFYTRWLFDEMEKNLNQKVGN
jgi:hypothetical protein